MSADYSDKQQRYRDIVAEQEKKQNQKYAPTYEVLPSGEKISAKKQSADEYIASKIKSSSTPYASTVYETFSPTSKEQLGLTEGKNGGIIITSAGRSTVYNPYTKAYANVPAESGTSVNIDRVSNEMQKQDLRREELLKQLYETRRDVPEHFLRLSKPIDQLKKEYAYRLYQTSQERFNYITGQKPTTNRYNRLSSDYFLTANKAAEIKHVARELIITSQPYERAQQLIYSKYIEKKKQLDITSKDPIAGLKSSMTDYIISPVKGSLKSVGVATSAYLTISKNILTPSKQSGVSLYKPSSLILYDKIKQKSPYSIKDKDIGSFIGTAAFIGAATVAPIIATTVAGGFLGYDIYKTVKEPTPFNIARTSLNAATLGIIPVISKLKGTKVTITSAKIFKQPEIKISKVSPFNVKLLTTQKGERATIYPRRSILEATSGKSAPTVTIQKGFITQGFTKYKLNIITVNKKIYGSISNNKQTITFKNISGNKLQLSYLRNLAPGQVKVLKARKTINYEPEFVQFNKKNIQGFSRQGALQIDKLLAGAKITRTQVKQQKYSIFGTQKFKPEGVNFRDTTKSFFGKAVLKLKQTDKTGFKSIITKYLDKLNIQKIPGDIVYVKNKPSYLPNTKKVIIEPQTKKPLVESVKEPPLVTRTQSKFSGEFNYKITESRIKLKYIVAKMLSGKKAELTPGKQNLLLNNKSNIQSKLLTSNLGFKASKFQILNTKAANKIIPKTTFKPFTLTSYNVKTSSISVFKPATRTNLIQPNNIKSMFNYDLKSNVGVKSQTKTSAAADTKIKTLSTFSTKQSNITKTTAQTKTQQISQFPPLPFSMTKHAPNIKPPRIIPPFIPVPNPTIFTTSFSDVRFIKKKIKKQKSTKNNRTFKVTPSLIGSAFKIKGIRQNRYTGLEVRPYKIIR